MLASSKILINALSAQKGGGQTYLLNLLNSPELRTGISVSLVVSDKNREIFDKLPNIEIIESKFAGINLITRFLWENFVLPLLLVKRNIDCLYSVSGILPKFYLPLRCKKVTICQNMLPFCRDELNRLRSLKLRMKFILIRYSQWFSFVRSDLIIFISEFGKEVITGLPLLKNKKTVVIPHGIPDVFRYSTDLEPLNLGYKYTLYVSSFFEYKAQVELVKAWSLLSDNIKRERKLVLIGPEGSGYRQEVAGTIQELDLKEEVLIIGEVKYQDLPRYYRNAELLVFSSSCENCPNILLEGLASGVLTLSSRFPPMPEFAKDSVVYFDPYNIDELKSRLEDFFTNKIDKNELVEKAKKYSDLYSWKNTANQTWKIIQNI